MTHAPSIHLHARFVLHGTTGIHVTRAACGARTFDCWTSDLAHVTCRACRTSAFGRGVRALERERDRRDAHEPAGAFFHHPYDELEYLAAREAKTRAREHVA
ncbi:MAG TPA: hypothetical protein VKE69_01070 [Planctomycetota bacterium]|nr:hypothetical protein [Planctomycetota bacterium]